ncbi:uncharacterized protein EI90DRAFT_3059449, partial [Cantharellus anzutake]|uniref:uncharacterized protein n=1 Tax=Cantharellus anzutake TaxID=1750568 RepID=UPI001907180B
YVAEGLVDHEVVLKWLFQLLGGVDLAQLGFATVIVQEYFEMLAENRTFLAPLLEGCLESFLKLSLVHSRTTSREIKGFWRLSFRLRPECFVHPKMWYQHTLILSSISSRNDAITFRSLPRAAASLRSTIVDIQMLNSIGPTTNLREVRFLSTEQENETWSQTFTRKLNILRTWSHKLDPGEHRSEKIRTRFPVVVAGHVGNS